MPAKTAKLFVNGGSQAVRLPAEFRFEESVEVYIRRDHVTGEVILSPKPGINTWAAFFALRDKPRCRRISWRSDRSMSRCRSVIRSWTSDGAVHARYGHRDLRNPR